MQESRAPQGARGLKCHRHTHADERKESRPARGAWVEMRQLALVVVISSSRAPQGARGLKYRISRAIPPYQRSRPARGAWVEMPAPSCFWRCPPQSRPARGAWVEIRIASATVVRLAPSRPARGAWVEIFALGKSNRIARGRAPQGARGLKYVPQHG